MKNKPDNDAEAPNDVEEYDPKTSTKQEDQDYREKVKKNFKYDLAAHDNYIKDFDAYEAMLISRPYDSISKKVQNGLSDGRTTTIYQERAARVSGKLPDGHVDASGEKDEGIAALLEIIRTKWVYPNANAQKKLLQKFRLWQFNSSVYGFMPMFYDWNVTETGYVGPDCWLWHPRNFIPQLGRSSIDDMDYCFTITYVSEDYLEDILEQDDSGDWDKDEVRMLLEQIKDSEKGTDVSNQRHSLITRTRQFQSEKGRILLATCYEAGDDGNWSVFAPEYSDVFLRVTPNPHKNGRLPFVIKYATDLFDNFYGLGDFQRAKPLQFANDGLDNFYFAGIKRGLYPPTIINPAGVVKSSINHEPGAIWLENVPNSIREYHADPVGMSTYQSAKQIMTGALTYQSGSTKIDMTSSESGDPAASKTDAGVNQQTEQQDTRDTQDRFQLEQAQEELIDRMMGLIPVIGTETIPITLFSTDIEELIDSGYGDSLKSLESSGMMKISKSGQSAKLSIPAGTFKDMELRFHMTYGSTSSQDKAAQLKSVDSFVKDMTSMQNEIVEMKNQGMTIDWKLIAEIKGRLSDVPQLGKIFRPMNPQEAQQWQQSQSQQNAPPPQPHPQIKMLESLPYDKAPPDIQRQMEQLAGFTPSTQGTTVQQNLDAVKAATAAHTAIHNTPEMQAAVAQDLPAPAPLPPMIQPNPAAGTSN